MNTASVSRATASSDRLEKLLFGHEDKNLRNIKFYRGDNEIVSPDQMRDVAHSVIVASRSGHLKRFTEFPDIDQVPVNVVTLAKGL